MRTRRFLLLLLLLATAFPLSAQMQQPVETVLAQKSFKKFRQFSDSITKANSRVRSMCEISRELVSGYTESVYDIEQSVPDPNNKAIASIYTHRVKLVTAGDAIIYYELCEMKNRKEAEIWVPYYEPLSSYRNDGAYTLLKAAFKNTFGAELDETALFSDDLFYGENCGYGGGTPAGRMQVNTFVANKDKASLLLWLQSSNAEKQVYAVDGLYQLHKAGVEITPEEKAMIEAVKAKKGMIHTCSGCIHMNREISEVTKKFKF